MGGETYLDVLERKQKLFVMYNKENGIEILCTPKYVKAWIQRGFEVLAEKDNLSLV